MTGGRAAAASGRGVRSGLLAGMLTLTVAGCANGAGPGSDPGDEVGVRPVSPPVSAEVLEYCPDMPAVLFDADPSAVEEIRVCTTVFRAEFESPLPIPLPDEQPLDEQPLDELSPQNVPVEPGPSVQLPPPSQPRERAARVTSGAEELLDAYGRGDIDDGATDCSFVLADPLIVWIVIDGDVRAIRAPVDQCNFPVSEAQDAFDAVQTETIVEVGA